MSDERTELTTVWNDGQVLRRDIHGRTFVRPPSLTIEEVKELLDVTAYLKMGKKKPVSKPSLLDEEVEL